MKKITRTLAVLALFTLALTLNSFAGRGLLMDFRPAPDLFYPVTEDIDLGGKAGLWFRWRQTNIAQTDHYEFRLYKGYDMLESSLLLKQDILRDSSPFELAAANFEVNQVYTWSLKQVYLGGQKSERSFSAFKIIKK